MANQRPKNNGRTVKTNNVCVVCGVIIAHKNAHARYCSKRCYYQSPAYKRTQANYARSPKGKATMKKYQSSPKGKAAEKRYRQSPKGIAAQRRATERFKQRAKNQDILAELMAGLDEHSDGI